MNSHTGIRITVELDAPKFAAQVDLEIYCVSPDFISISALASYSMCIDAPKWLIKDVYIYAMITIVCAVSTRKTKVTYPCQLHKGCRMRGIQAHKAFNEQTVPKNIPSDNSWITRKINPLFPKRTEV